MPWPPVNPAPSTPTTSAARSTSPTWPLPCSNWLESPHTGIAHLVGADALSRYELGRLIAVRDGLDPATLPVGRGGHSDVRLDNTFTQKLLKTTLRGAREFLAQPQGGGVVGSQMGRTSMAP